MTPQQLHAAYATLATTEEGRIVLGDLERQFGFSTRSLFEGDVNQAIHRDGARSVLVYIARMMTTQPAPDEDYADV